MPSRQAGQAALALLAFLGSLLGGFFYVLNVGQLVTDKMRLVTAADAAAYSAAVWEARSLNYQAYLNRAIVANEVAIAQAVSLRSWSNHVDRVLEHASIATSWVPGLGQAVQALERGWDGVDRGLQATLPPLEAALSTWNVTALVTAQDIAQQQALPGAAALVTEVVRANEPRAETGEATRLLQLRNAAAWQQLTRKNRRGGTDLVRYRDLLHDARDGFTARRAFDPLPSNPFVSLPRRGGTDLLGEHAWRAVDTWSLHVESLFGGSETPVAWGAAEARSRPVAVRGEHGGARRTNPRAARLAESGLSPRNTYRGIPEIRDIARPVRQEDLRLVYGVSLRLPAGRIASADRLLVPRGLDGGAGAIDAGLRLPDDALHAVSAAEVVFRRPTARRDGRREYPSLFNPYWQVRPVEAAAAERQLTAAARGVAADPFAVLP